MIQRHIKKFFFISIQKLRLFTHAYVTLLDLLILAHFHAISLKFNVVELVRYASLFCDLHIFDAPEPNASSAVRLKVCLSTIYIFKFLSRTACSS